MANRSSAAVGFTIFAGVMLVLIGLFQFSAGLTSLTKDNSKI